MKTLMAQPLRKRKEKYFIQKSKKKTFVERKLQNFDRDFFVCSLLNYNKQLASHVVSNISLFLL